jgi:hypothetical protein
MTRHLHRATAKRHHHHDSVALSPSWLGIYIPPRPSSLDSAVTIMTWQHCRQYDSAFSLPHDQRRLSSAVINMTRQHHHQHDSTSMSRNCLIIKHQQYMTSAGSRHAASSYRYYSPLCLVIGPMQVSHYATWLLYETSMFSRLTFEYFKL